MERNERTKHRLSFPGCDIGLGRNVEITNDESRTWVEISLFVMVMVLETSNRLTILA